MSGSIPKDYLRFKEELNEEMEHRAYLPLKLNSTITQLLISSLHHLHHHPGTSTLLAIISEQYHIPGLRNHLKLLNRKCVTCQKILGNPVNQRMGLLPHHRTTPSKPFDISGVDFAGPFLIHRGNPHKPTRVKVYAAVFVCFTTQALHFELCSDLSASGFIAAFRRFTARRGTPTHLYSDGGSYFVGARREMKEAQTLLHNETTTNHFNHLTTTKKFHWYFSPPPILFSTYHLPVLALQPDIELIRLEKPTQCRVVRPTLEGGTY